MVKNSIELDKIKNICVTMKDLLTQTVRLAASAILKQLMDTDKITLDVSGTINSMDKVGVKAERQYLNIFE